MSFMDDMNTAAGEEKEFEILPEGTYTATLEDVEDAPHPEDGIVRSNLEFHITEGEHKDRRVWEKVKHSETMLWKAGKIYNGMGLKVKLADWKAWSEAMAEQTGRSFLITTVNRKWEDKVITDVKRLQPNDEVPF